MRSEQGTGSCRPGRLSGNPDVLEKACLLLLIATLVAFSFFGPISLPPTYFAFADGRSLALPGLSIPNAANVLSNAAYLATGLAGLALLKRAPAGQQWPLGLLWLGLVLVSAGSAQFHWAPGEATLVADRIPMALAISGAIGAAVAERLSPTASLRWTLGWLYLSLVGIFLAAVVDDARLYLVAQAGGFALLALLAAMPVKEGMLRLPWVWALTGYFAAKLFEIGDGLVWNLPGFEQVVSGHTLKHVVSAAGLIPLLVALRRER